jgi:hypothetical protein
MRRLRRSIEIALPVVGTLVVCGAVVFEAPLAARLLLALVGLVLVHAGVWQLSRPLLPDGREYVALRAEVDRFVGLVRELNRQAVSVKDQGSPVAELTMREIHREMQASTARMWSFAGKTGAEPLRDRGPAQTASAAEK